MQQKSVSPAHIRFTGMGSLAAVFLLSMSAAVTTARPAQAAVAGRSGITNAEPPSAAVKLIFIHHSCGENWLNDGNGGLGLALRDNHYFVSDTNYGWGPDSIGSRTDIPQWMEWFRGGNTPAIMAALYAESGQHSTYSRLSTDPGGENEIIMFKSCFPNSALEGNPGDSPDPDGYLTVGHAKYVYNELLVYFEAHPDKLFVVVTAPPLLSGTYAANARAFNLWLVNDWLKENAYPLENVAVFDFYNVLTGPDNHHRYSDHWIEHVFTPGMNTLYYPSGDDHPNAAGNQKATAEFVPLLNVFYHRWKSAAALDDCPLFPSNNIWNARVDDLPVHARSGEWIDTIGRYTGFHMDFGSGTWAGGPIGIPYNIADAATPLYSVLFDYAGESDPGPYPIPDDPLIEYGSDRHLLTVDRDTCTLYELYDAEYSGGQWYAGSGAIWDLNSNALRPAGWTSADAAGLPILPGLVRYDEIVAGEIDHAIRFTASSTNGYIWPARHLTSDNPAAPHIPPMGARFRLNASYDISGFPVELQVILTAMKRYGIILADNGSPWFVSGTPDERWDNDMLHELDVLTGDDFEAVDASVLMVDPDSGEVVADIPPGAFGKDSPTDTGNASTHPTLTWESSGGAEEYEYCIDTSDNDVCDSSWISAATSQSVDLSGLINNTAYYWQVRAANTSGTTEADEGGWWNFTARTQTFSDVPISHWAWSYIERLYAAGITSGCGDGNYCPGTAVTRAQMAVFLERGMRGSSYTPPAASGTVFGDVTAATWGAAWIEQLYTDGITSGCGSGNYCPGTAVTRAQMAVFLLRAKHGASYTPPPATGTMFGDVTTAAWGAAWIEQLATEGITEGCGGGNYCPSGVVARASMAVLLVRTFNLP